MIKELFALPYLFILLGIAFIGSYVAKFGFKVYEIGQKMEYCDPLRSDWL